MIPHPLGYSPASLPASWSSIVSAKILPTENVLGWMQVDLDAQLCFNPGILICTEGRLLSVEKDAKGDPVLVAVVGSAVFCRKRQQFEDLREFATGRQENTSDVEQEDYDHADKEGNIGPDRLAEGLCDAESHASDQILKVCHHEEHSLLV